MQFTDSQVLGVHWLWWVAAAAGVLFAWSLAPMRLPRAGRRQRGEGTATLAVQPLLWTFPPDEVVKVLMQQPGVQTIRLDLARGVARVVFDPRETSAAKLQDFIGNCAYHCRGDRVPGHSCPAGSQRPLTPPSASSQHRGPIL